MAILASRYRFYLAILILGLSSLQAGFAQDLIPVSGLIRVPKYQPPMTPQTPEQLGIAYELTVGVPGGMGIPLTGNDVGKYFARPLNDPLHTHHGNTTHFALLEIYYNTFNDPPTPIDTGAAKVVADSDLETTADYNGFIRLGRLEPGQKGTAMARLQNHRYRDPAQSYDDQVMIRWPKLEPHNLNLAGLPDLWDIHPNEWKPSALPIPSFYPSGYFLKTRFAGRHASDNFEKIFKSKIEIEADFSSVCPIRSIPNSQIFPWFPEGRYPTFFQQVGNTSVFVTFEPDANMRNPVYPTDWIWTTYYRKMDIVDGANQAIPHFSQIRGTTTYSLTLEGLELVRQEDVMPVMNVCNYDFDRESQHVGTVNLIGNIRVYGQGKTYARQLD